MKYALPILALIGLAGLVFLFIGPRMDRQPHIKTFQAQEPLLPKGVIPVEPVSGLPSEKGAEAMTNPLSATPEILANGKTYYGYYCLFCHGDTGHGDGPVGQSYVPKPADLAAAKIQSRSDGQLLRAMLAGTGHEPVLERVVPPEHRWQIVLYVRSLSGTGAATTSSITPLQ